MRRGQIEKIIDAYWEKRDRKRRKEKLDALSLGLGYFTGLAILIAGFLIGLSVRCV